MKQPIEWHEQCLVNVRRSLADAQRRAAFAVAECDRIQAYVAHFERQIAEAKRRGMDSFDADRLLKARKDKP